MTWKKSEIIQALFDLKPHYSTHQNFTLKEDDLIHSIQFDSRKIIPTDCFVAIEGVNHDGHDFVEKVYQSGAKIAIVKRMVDCDIEQILVSDTLKALHQLALFWRKKFDCKIIAITGSNGKTTTKHILASILERKAPTMSTYKNYNNEFGVPITLFELRDKHQFAVIELGATKPKDIETLTSMVLPDISIVTNINEAHLKSFKDIDTIASTKAEIYQQLSPSGVAIVNLDDSFAQQFIAKIHQTKARIVSFSSKDNQANVFASDITISLNRLKFKLHYDSQSFLIETRHLLGLHNLSNILAALAACYVLGIRAQTIKTALEKVTTASHRLEQIGSNDRIRLIDDSYNANPSSTKYAIDFLDLYKNPKIFVLGDMYELGEKSDFYHLKIGEKLNASHIDHILLFGKSAKLIVSICQRAKYFSDISYLITYLEDLLQESSQCHSVLIKGSRAMKMERVVNFLKEQYL